jgi:hypothetical protein
MKYLCFSLVALALAVQPGLGRPSPKPHHHHNGPKLLAQKGLGPRHTGTYHLHSHKGHHTYVKLKKGKVTGLYLKTPGGKTLLAKPARRTAALSLPKSDPLAHGPEETTFVSLDDTPPGGAMIRFTIQTPFFTISFWFPASSVDPSAGGTGGAGGGEGGGEGGGTGADPSPADDSSR